MNRRDFLSHAGLTIGGLALSSCVTTAPYDVSRLSKAGSKGQVVFGYLNPKSRNSAIRFLNWDDLSYKDLEIPLQFPHQVKKNALNPDEYFIFDYLGSFMKVNAVTQEYQLVDNKIEKNFFQGHGIQTNDGSQILSVESNFDNTVYALVVRSAANLQKLDVIGTYSDMHHILTMPNSTIVAYPAKSQSTNLCGIYFYDYQKKKNVRVFETEHNYPSHLSIVTPTEVMFPTIKDNFVPHSKLVLNSSVGENLIRLYDSSTTGHIEPSPIYRASVDGTGTQFWDESNKRMMSHGISASYIKKSKKMVATFYQTDLITLWSEGKIVKTGNIKKPINLLLSADESEIMAFSSEDANLKIFSADDLREIRTISCGPEHRICSLSSYS
ncbi:MAG: hypothetical protein ACXVBD_04300 [Pseudobdellovibrio sp.]